jgi:hypothetical protein
MADKIKQGDSYWVDVKGDISTVDAVWANWSSTWAIVQAIGGAPIASGTSYKTATPGYFITQVPPTATEPLAEGDYFLIIQVANSVAVWKQEVSQAKFTVKTQGIPG